MGGLYADVPTRRMPYHRDGTIACYYHVGSAITTLTQGQMENWNNESNGTYINVAASGVVRYFAFVFPELRNLAAYYVVALFQSGPNNLALQTSTDTTNGQDGTWTQQVANFGYTGGFTYRTSITTLAVSGIKGVRFQIQAGDGGSDNAFIYNVHLYGTYDASATRYLMITDTSGVEVTGGHFDFDDDPRGGVAEVIQFKVKNGHGTLTANTITVGRQVLTEKSPTFVDDYEFSDGGAYASSLSISSLAPGASSGTLSLRRTTPVGAQLGLEAGLITVTAASWS